MNKQCFPRCRTVKLCLDLYSFFSSPPLLHIVQVRLQVVMVLLVSPRKLALRGFGVGLDQVQLLLGPRSWIWSMMPLSSKDPLTTLLATAQGAHAGGKISPTKLQLAEQGIRRCQLGNRAVAPTSLAAMGTKGASRFELVSRTLQVTTKE